MKRLSKPCILGSYIAVPIVISILVLVMFVVQDPYFYTPEELPWGYIVAPGVMIALLLIYLVVVLCVFVHNYWASIQDRHARTSPCRALGFLFIPFFHYYWIFQAVWGFAVDFNKYIARNNVSTAQRLPEGLFLAYCILYVVSFIPYVGWAAILPYYVIGAILVNKICDAVNALPTQSVNEHRQ